MAYGARLQDNGELPIKMLGGNSVEIFKDFSFYDYEIEPLSQMPGEYDCWIMRIYNKETHEEVARYE